MTSGGWQRERATRRPAPSWLEREWRAGGEVRALIVLLLIDRCFLNLSLASGKSGARRSGARAKPGCSGPSSAEFPVRRRTRSSGGGQWPGQHRAVRRRRPRPYGKSGRQEAQDPVAPRDRLSGAGGGAPGGRQRKKAPRAACRRRRRFARSGLEAIGTCPRRIAASAPSCFVVPIISSTRTPPAMSITDPHKSSPDPTLADTPASPASPASSKLASSNQVSASLGQEGDKGDAVGAEGGGRQKKGVRFWLIICSLLVATFIAALDLTGTRL